MPCCSISEKSLALCRWLAILTAIAAPISTAVTSVASIALLLVWLISGELLTSLKISVSQAAGKMLLLFFAWLLLSALYADTAWDDKYRTVMSWKKLAFTFLLLGLFYQERWKQCFVKSYLAVMTAAASIALLLWSADIVIREGRAPGIFMTNYSSQSMAFIAAGVCSIFMMKQPLSARKKGLLAGAIVLFTFNIYFISEARSGYLSYPFAMIFAVCYLYGFKKLPHVVGVAAILLTVILLTSSTLQQRIGRGLDEKDSYQTSEQPSSIGVRMVLAKNTLALIKENPVLGYGTSSFKSVYGAYVADKYSDWRNEPISDPHNQYLFVWLENGVIGLLIFIAYIIAAIRQGLQQPPYGGMAVGFLIAVCVSSLFNSHFKTFPEGNLLAFYVGILLSHRNQESENSPGLDSAKANS